MVKHNYVNEHWSVGAYIWKKSTYKQRKTVANNSTAETYSVSALLACDCVKYCSRISLFLLCDLVRSPNSSKL